ncbi:hypothetical protein [Gordonia sputi]
MPAPPGVARSSIPSGGFTSAEATGQTDEAIRTVHAVLANCGISMSPSRVSRLVRRFEYRINGTGEYSLLDYLGSQVQLTAEQRRQIADDPDMQRVFGWPDPTGEDAVRRVMQERGF